MKHITRWSPDTCKCVLEYEWDDLDRPTVHTFSKLINACDLHGKIDLKDIFARIKKDNQTKNVIKNELLVNTANYLVSGKSDVEAKENLEEMKLVFYDDASFDVELPSETAIDVKKLEAYCAANALPIKAKSIEEPKP